MQLDFVFILIFSSEYYLVPKKLIPVKASLIHLVFLVR